MSRRKSSPGTATGPQRWVRVLPARSQPAQVTAESFLAQVMMKSSVTRTCSDNLSQGASVASPVARSMRLLDVTRTVEVMASGCPSRVIDHSSRGRPSVRPYPRSRCSLLAWS